MHFDHVNTTNPIERVYSSLNWQHEFKTFPELNHDENGFIELMAMSQKEGPFEVAKAYAKVRKKDS